MNIARSGLKLFLADFSRKALAFAGLVFFAQQLEPHILGTFFLFQASIGLLSIPADVGISEGIVKRLSEGENRSKIISTALLLKLVPIILLSLGILTFRQPIAAYLGETLAIFLIAALLLNEFANFWLQILRGELRVGETALPLLFRQIVYIGVSVALILQGFGLFGLVYGFIAGLIAMSIWAGLRSKPTFGRPNLDSAKSLLQYSKFSFITSVGGYFYEWMDILVIGFILGQEAVGVYEVSWRVTIIVLLFSQAIATTIFPQISQWNAEDAASRIESLLPEAITMSLFFVIPAFFGILLLSEEILQVVFGSEYVGGTVVLIILTSEKLLQAVHLILGKALKAIGYPDLAAKSGISAMALNGVLNVTLVWQFGIVGAAVATVISFAVNTFLHAYYLSTFLEIRFPLVRIGCTTLASLGMFLLLLALTSRVTPDTPVRLAATVLLGVVLYGSFVVALPPLRRTVITNFRRLIS